MKKFVEYSSPWAFVLSFALVSWFLSLLTSMKIFESVLISNWWGVKFSTLMIIMTMIMWFRDSFRESTIGVISDDNSTNIKVGIILFLLSEALFFLSFFWMYTYSALSPEMNIWPPINLWSPSFIGAPSLNTVLLVSSSATVTMSHFESNFNKHSNSLYWLMFTLLLSLMFIFIQMLEYKTLPFDFTSGIGGAIFFLATGFHGIHVMIGTIALITCLMLMVMKFFTKSSMMSYEISIWYWHFVDAIWLMLYSMFYCWGH